MKPIKTAVVVTIPSATDNRFSSGERLGELSMGPRQNGLTIVKKTNRLAGIPYVIEF
jgi:hypothetical protein